MEVAIAWLGLTLAWGGVRGWMPEVEPPLPVGWWPSNIRRYARPPLVAKRGVGCGSCLVFMRRNSFFC